MLSLYLNVTSLEKLYLSMIFRDMSISPVIFKLFEHLILDRFCTLLVSSENQFVIKNESSCSHDIHTVKTVVDYYNKDGSTVNLCGLDLSKTRWTTTHCLLNLWRGNCPSNLYASLKTDFNCQFAGIRNCLLLQIIGRRARRRRFVSLQSLVMVK